MIKDVKVIEKRDRTLFVYPFEPGKTQRIDEYWTIRAGVSWPNVKAPGYYCIVGAKNDLSAGDSISLVLINEGQSEVIEKIFEKLMINANKFSCSQILARLDGDKGPERAYYRFRGRREIDCPGLLDSSEFENFTQDVPLIRQWLKKGALRVAPDSVLRSQLASLKPEDVGDSSFEERSYAVASLCRVLKSLNIYPVQRGGGQGVYFTNVVDRGKSKRDDYWEVIVD